MNVDLLALSEIADHIQGPHKATIEAAIAEIGGLRSRVTDLEGVAKAVVDAMCDSMEVYSIGGGDAAFLRANTARISATAKDRERLSRRVAELEAAAQPRPMSEAPRDGTPFLAQRAFGGFCPAGQWGIATSRSETLSSVTFKEGFEVMANEELAGWLPLPESAP